MTTQMNPLRCRLEQPIEAAFGPNPVRISEVGRESALLSHDVPTFAGARAHLLFRAGGQLFQIPANVSRCSIDRSRSIADGSLVYNSEIRFSSLPPGVSFDLGQIVDVLSLSAPPIAATEALQFEIVAY